MFYYLICFLVVITVSLSLFYFFIIGAFCLGWKKTVQLQIKQASIPVAVIVAARNEEKNIGECLRALIAQAYPFESVELIVVNDGSTDKTEDIAKEYAVLHSNIRLINLSDYNLTGKKHAISTAVANTSAELIVTTDADCIMGKRWLQSIVSFYDQTKSKMIVGPVAFRDEKGMFQKMQSLEIMALAGSTCGALYYGKAIMCNGANLAYAKQVFDEVNGFRDIDEKPTGDDVLLMYKVSNKYKNSVKFLKDPEAIVYTGAKKEINDFVEQRKRWASKDFRELNTETKIVSMTVYLFNFMILLVGALTGFASVKSAIYLSFFEICLILLGIKCLIDFLLLFLAAAFFKKKRLLYLFLPEQFIFILYVVVIGVLGRKGTYSWKERKYSNN